VPIRTVLAVFTATTVLVITGLWVGNNVNLLPPGASSNASTYDELFKVLFSIGTVLFLGIVVLLIYSMIRFRRRSGDMSDGLAIEGNLPLEIVWTAIPAVVVLFVGLYSYDIYERMGGMATLNDHMAMDHGAMQQVSVKEGDTAGRVWGGIGVSGMEAAPGGPVLPVEVTAMQFAFIFHYPGSDITTGELHVPTGQQIELHMEARDVIHAFWVPQFRLKQDIIPGQPTVLSFTATRAGTYPIICAELCGPYHGGMRSNVIVQEPEAYDNWLQQNTPNSTNT